MWDAALGLDFISYKEVGDYHIEEGNCTVAPMPVEKGIPIPCSCCGRLYATRQSHRFHTKTCTPDPKVQQLTLIVDAQNLKIIELTQKLSLSTKKNKGNTSNTNSNNTNINCNNTNTNTNNKTVNNIIIKVNKFTNEDLSNIKTEFEAMLKMPADRGFGAHQGMIRLIHLNRDCAKNINVYPDLFGDENSVFFREKIDWTRNPIAYVAEKLSTNTNHTQDDYVEKMVAERKDGWTYKDGMSNREKQKMRVKTNNTEAAIKTIRNNCDVLKEYCINPPKIY